MINGKTVLAVILARGGSKGIPGKNIKIINGTPLIGWTIKAAKNSKYIDRVVVSTDSDNISKVARKYGAETPFVRPKQLSSDKAISEDAIYHCVKWIEKNEGKTYYYLVLLQPTSPLRNSFHIDAAFEKIEKNKKAHSITSVKRVEKNPYIIKKTNKGGFIINFLKTDNHSPRRQETKDLVVPNGAIYISRVKDFNKNLSLHNKCLPYEMDYISSWDIDEPIDFELAKLFFKNLSKLTK